MKTIWVAGDFFVDEFNIGNYRGNGPRFLIEKTISRQGGAGNTFENLISMCSSTKIHCLKTGQPPFTSKLQRYVNKIKLETIIEYWCGPHTWSKDTLRPDDYWQKYNEAQLLPKDSKSIFTALVASDYNKGFSQSYIPKNLSLDLLVVDSRYKTAPVNQLTKNAKTSIWRCTDDEYNKEYAMYFDWIIHTNHEREIILFKPEWSTSEKNKQSICFIPPGINVVDSIGAGDTFTAGIAAYLTNAAIPHETIIVANIIFAIEFAIKAAQNVCKKPWTATTDIKLE